MKNMELPLPQDLVQLVWDQHIIHQWAFHHHCHSAVLICEMKNKVSLWSEGIIFSYPHRIRIRRWLDEQPIHSNNKYFWSWYSERWVPLQNTWGPVLSIDEQLTQNDSEKQQQ
jgi:hypothetical protein